MAIRSDLGVDTPTFRGGMTHSTQSRGGRCCGPVAELICEFRMPST